MEMPHPASRHGAGYLGNYRNAGKLTQSVTKSTTAHCAGLLYGQQQGASEFLARYLDTLV